MICKTAIVQRIGIYTVSTVLVSSMFTKHGRVTLPEAVAAATCTVGSCCCGTLPVQEMTELSAHVVRLTRTPHLSSPWQGLVIFQQQPAW